MAQTAWAHLPNAKHIDWVIASIKVNPEKWDTVRTAEWKSAWYTAFDIVSGKEAWNEAWYTIWGTTWDPSRDNGRNAACGSTAGLITYDDCAYMIESDIDEIKILAKLGDQKAILLLPACIVFNETKALV